ncbi:MAG: hypothetical protein QM802_02785 [Agriterribacter sp.]
MFAPDQPEKKEDAFAVYKNFVSAYHAKIAFRKACRRLLNPEAWKRMDEAKKVEYILLDRNGRKIRRLMREHDFVELISKANKYRGRNFRRWLFIETVMDKRNRWDTQEYLAVKITVSGDPKQNAEGAFPVYLSDSKTIKISREGKGLFATKILATENRMDSALPRERDTTDLIPWDHFLEALMNDLT